MEIKLNIYTTKFCRQIERTATAMDFELSTGICSDVLNAINIDVFDGGIEALSDDSLKALAFNLIRTGYPFFIGLIQELFELTDDETTRLKLSEVVDVVIAIAKYSFEQLATTLGGNKQKN